jgi:hypothetical protein
MIEADSCVGSLRDRVAVRRSLSNQTGLSEIGREGRQNCRQGSCAVLMVGLGLGRFQLYRSIGDRKLDIESYRAVRVTLVVHAPYIGFGRRKQVRPKSTSVPAPIIRSSASGKSDI